MAAKRDMYEVLGVSRHATADEIRAAHRRLARKLHPDINKGPDAAAKFAELQDAYEVLSDPEKRKTYDQFGHAGLGGPPPGAEGGPWGGPGGQRPGTYTWTNVGGRGGPSRGNVDPSDIGEIFEEMFGGRAGGPFGGGFGGRSRPKARATKGRDVERTIEVGFLDAVRGVTTSVRIARASGTQTLEVRIPPGTLDGAKLRVRGEGMEAESGGPRGDLILEVRVGSHPVFRHEGGDLVVDLPLTIAEAALGARIRVPTLTGSLELTVPPGTSTGQRLRLRGQGISADHGGSGDLMAVARIVAPKDLSSADREALKAMAPRLGDPRTGPGWD
jgi:DnaJ-class molecular chaperone